MNVLFPLFSLSLVYTVYVCCCECISNSDCFLFVCFGFLPSNTVNSNMLVQVAAVQLLLCCFALLPSFAIQYIVVILLINNNQIVPNFISTNCGNAPGYYWLRRNFHYISRVDAALAEAWRRTDAGVLHLARSGWPDRTPAYAG